MNITSAILALSLSTGAWESLPGYPDNVYAIQGTMVETSGGFKRNIELVHIPKKKAFGVSFYNYNNKEDQAIIPSGTVAFRGCGFKTFGLIEGSEITFNLSNYKAMNKLTCGERVYVRVYDGYENYATYMFPHIEEIKRK